MIADSGIRRDVNQTLQAHVVADTCIPVNDGCSSDGRPVTNTGFLPDQGIMATLKIVTDDDITIDDSARPEYCMMPDSRSRKIGLSHIFPGRKPDGYRFEYL